MNLNPFRLIALSALTLSSLASLAAAVPVITEVIATPSTTAGGNTVVIRGTGLGTPSFVTIGGTSAPVTLATAGYIFCTAPAGQGRNLPVQVIEGPNPSNIVSTFSYDIPRVSNIDINSSPTSGNSTLTITGANFGISRVVTIGGNVATPTGVNNHNQIQVTIPPGQGANQPIVITCGGQTNIASETPTFSYNAPSISLITPNSGFSTAGGTATITGTNLGLTPQVLVNGIPTTILPGNTHTSLTFNIPAGSGTNIPVLVNVSGQISNTAVLSYPPPSIAFVFPSSGSTAGGNEVTLSGSNFGPGNTATILFDNIPVQNLSASPGHTSIKFVAPPGQGLVHTIRVNVSGQISNSINYSYNAPVITSITPVDFSIDGGDVVVISGTNLGTSGVVAFGGIPAPIIAQSHNSISCRAPAGTTPGSVPIVVIVAGQVSNTQFGNYTCPADFNNDGSVDFFDYLDFVAAFSTPC